MRIFRNIGETHGYHGKSMSYRPKRRKKTIGRRAARREDNMADDSTETKETDGNIGQEPPEQPHDVERTWRIAALAVAAIVIVGGGLCIGKKAGNASTDAANASAVANVNSEAKNSGDNGDEAYALTSPLPEERIAEKINEVCPNETYVIKNRSVGTDTSGNPYADYECTVTSGRDLVFEARDYVVEENGSKRRGFYCDYVEKVAGYHRKSVESILRESALDYTIDRDGMTYTVKVPDDAACETLAKAFTSIATEYARSESEYNTARWLDDTKVIGVFATGTESGNGVTLTCASTAPDTSSTVEKIKAAVDTAKSANRNGTNNENADKRQSEAKAEKLAKKKASQLIGKAKDERAISTKAGAFVGTTIVKKAKEAVDEAKNGKQENNVEEKIDEAKTEAIAKKQASHIVGKIESDTTLPAAAGKSLGTTIVKKAKEAVNEAKSADENEVKAKAETVSKKTASRIVSEIKAIGNPSYKTGTTIGTTIAKKAEKAVDGAKEADGNDAGDVREDKTEAENLAKKKLSRILESIREKTKNRGKGKKSLAAALAERSGTALEATRTGNAEKLRAKLLGSLDDAL